MISTILSIWNCKSNEDQFKKNDSNYKSSLLLLIKFRSEGNCLRSEKQSNGTKILYCDRKPSGLCDSKDLIYTSGEKTNRLKEISDITKKTSDCDAFILQAGLASEEITTDSQEAEINSNNSFQSILSCESSKIASDYSNLFSNEDLIFFQSTKGKIAIKAEAASISSIQSSLKTQGQNCLDKILTDDWTGIIDETKKKSIEDLRTGNKKKYVSCIYGDSNSNSKCQDGVLHF